MMRWIIVILLAAVPAYGQEKHFMLLGLGTQTCGQFANLYRRDPKGVELDFYSWAQGFMSGLNMSGAADKQPYYRDLHSMSVDSQEAQFRIYCDQHPLKTYVDAALYLYGELKQEHQ